jgi:BirA family biotin operon repressor/biotin-[acetyl-CoA-carboxylase] ligase
LSANSLPAVGFWASLAVVDAVADVCSITLALKWPNDLLLDGRKCGGILSEGRSSGSTTRVVVGVGLNVNRAAHVPPEIGTGAAWLSDAAGRAIDRTALLAAILKKYEAEFDMLVSAPELVIGRWAKRASLEGQRVSVRAVNGEMTHTGTVRGVSANGALELETADGMVSVLLGDVDVLS